MKKKIFAFLMTMLLVLSFGVAWAGIEDRITYQQKQIDNGISSRKLTRSEADIVQDNLNWIKARYARLVSSGYLSSAEQRSIQRMLDQNEAMIFKKKGNLGRMYESSLKERITTQQKRIDEGIRSGKLTRGETDTLQDNLNWIKMRMAKLKADRVMTPSEWQSLDSMLDQNSGMISREKNDLIRKVY